MFHFSIYVLYILFFPNFLNGLTPPLLESDSHVLVLRHRLLLRASLCIDHLPKSCSDDSRKRVLIDLLQVLSISHLPTSCFGAICSTADSRERQLFT
uniref:Secreted protein n=1 Tax=Lactuca sativa TaxID=4236 RepID=A0A9R1VHC5_LACSA|nr:hypothetical protein LSAT_V11C500280640 [Lactuca sativa]